MHYEVWSKDGFDMEAEPFHLVGKYDPPDEPGIQFEYDTPEEALEAARRYLSYLSRTQPDAGGQGGIQDRVYVMHPDGGLRRILSL